MSLTATLTEKCSGADFDPADFDSSDFETELFGATGGLTEKDAWTASLTDKGWRGKLTEKYLP